MKRLLLLGASGSIGSQTINVVKHHKDMFYIIGCSIGYQIHKIAEIINDFPEIQSICVAEESDKQKLQKQYSGIEFYAGEAGLKAICELCNYDILVNAVVGFRGLVPTLTAIHRDKDIALANKESLVTGGELVKQALCEHPNVNMYPIDSEHSAIFQCLQGNDKQDVQKLIITASGGSFRDRKREDLWHVSPQEALRHPNWNMGGRITIDSATMMNKGFEVIEAHYLFDIPFEQIETIIHHESIIHSMVLFQDQAIMAQMGNADMRLPIQYALTYPRREILYDSEPIDLQTITAMHFQPMDFERFPLLKLAYEVGKRKGNGGAVMNGADECAVAAFLNGKISFLEIENCIQRAVDTIDFIKHPTLKDLQDSDAKARAFVYDYVERKSI